MSAKRSNSSNKTLVYILAIVVIVLLVMYFGGSGWLNGAHGRMSMNMAHWNWTQILISLGVGVVLGWFVSKRL
ncbi:hypothetical protein [Williamwhitmania taraxaci]|uniref:Uncharacterized protein n=1 Tax=Williamwhitmania taraxaci TaxID=1640674 RepID=A0A1G6PVS3_9BACT|nr:hypothetical protein [Williamwhitmania taraxaci]SDC83465.1 hypothetical protein SAMN05216323_10553 [Williamwhitmania taraxaci]